MHSILTSKSKEIQQLCQKYEVQRLYAFGSVTSPYFDPNRSDLDILVAFRKGLTPKQMGANMLAMMDDLEALFSRKVDLLRERTFTNPYFSKAVDSSKMIVYAAA